MIKMEDYGGRNTRENAKNVLKKFGPMTATEVALKLEPGMERSNPRIVHLRSRIARLFNQDMKRYGEIEVCGKTKGKGAHVENLFRWVGDNQ